ncbi:MAG: Ig-like domain-containing protein [Planctomycetota bacterium]|nr:Ig-like domain-containing protein [Planctomycetota bacterium]
MGPPTADVEEGAVHHVIVRFDNAIDHSTFTTADIVFKRGSVTIPITSVERVNNTTSRANFATQTVRGSYTIQIGPNIVDTSGNLMNQDGDSTNGESVDDRASSVFEIGVVADTQHPVVTSAHADKTSVMQGEIIELFWSAQDNIAIDHVALYLYQGAAVVDTNVFGVPEGHLDGRIAVGAENIATDGDGSFKWKVFGDLPAAEYRIKVVAWDTSGNPSNALPTDFKWVEFIVRESVDDDIKPTVALTSPHTGNFNVGDTLTIEGSASDASDISHVQVELYQGGLLPQHRIGIIHPGNIGDGDRDKVVWTIPSVLNGHILNGSNYKIKWIAVHRLSRQWHRLRPTNR